VVFCVVGVTGVVIGAMAVLVVAERRGESLFSYKYFLY
jgi:gas vesicle protein